jgi:hypothetical protein
MEQDFDGEFKLAEYAAPCCGATLTLNQLECDWPQGFGGVAIEAMNPAVDELDDEQKAELERVLGPKLRVVRQML